MGRVAFALNLRKPVAAEAFASLKLACSHMGEPRHCNWFWNLLRSAFGIQPSEGAEASRRRISDALHSRGEFADILPLMQDFMGVADPSSPATKDPTARKLQLLSFIRRYIQARPYNEIAVLIIDDIHWIDPSSEEFLDSMIDAIVGTKTLIVLNFRPGLTAPWMQRSHYRQIGLAPLASEEAAELLRDMLGDDPSVALLSRNIAERARGNPFFMEELVRSLIERGDFDGDRGSYRLKGGLDTIPLPVTVQAVLSARIDRLPEAAKADPPNLCCDWPRGARRDLGAGN